MCFSTEASFAAGVILSAAGVVLLKKFYNTKLIFLALIPLFFGIQQFAEGVLWVGLEHNAYPNAWSLSAQHTFLFFAEMLWPIWIPFAFLASEKVLWRKIVLGVLLLLGALFFLNVAYNFFIYGGPEARIIDHSISYGGSPLLDRIIYGIIVLAPFFIASIPKMWILGIANLIVFIVADISYNYAFVSVWCFAAAIIMIGLFLLLEKDSPKIAKQPDT